MQSYIYHELHLSGKSFESRVLRPATKQTPINGGFDSNLEALSLIVTESADTTTSNVDEDDAVDSWQILVKRCKRVKTLRDAVMQVDMTQHYPGLQKLVRPWTECMPTADALPLIN